MKMIKRAIFILLIILIGYAGNVPLRVLQNYFYLMQEGYTHTEALYELGEFVDTLGQSLGMSYQEQMRVQKLYYASFEPIETSCKAQYRPITASHRAVIKTQDTHDNTKYLG
jgi:hypothetical protein